MSATSRTYLIVSGEYSDYGVVAVCDDEATATAWAKALCEHSMWDHDARVVEAVRVATGSAPSLHPRVELTVRLYDDGTCTAAEAEEYRDMEIGSSCVVMLPGARPRVAHRAITRSGTPGVLLDITARTRDEALKVYGDHHAQWRADPVGYRVSRTQAGVAHNERGGI